MPAALQAPDACVRPVLDHLGRARIASEEVLADERPVFALVGLEVAVGSVVHETDERSFAILREQFVPPASPHDLDDVPAGSAEDALELLDDLAVAAHRSVEALQVAVDDERQVVEFLACGK